MKYFIFGALLIFSATDLYAECTVDKTITQCIEEDTASNTQDDTQEVFAEMTTRAGASLSRALTGGTASGNFSGLDDFNPLFALSGLNGINGSGTGLEFSVSDFLDGVIQEAFLGLSETPVPESNNHYKLVVQKLDAQIYEPLDASITDAAARQTILGGIGEFGNLDIALRYAPPIMSKGRALSSYGDWITRIQSAVPEEAEQCNQDEFSLKIFEIFGDVDFEKPLSEIYTDGSENTAEQIAALFNALYTEHKASEALCYTAYRDSIFDSGLSNLALLVNNQSQLVFSLNSKIRDEAAGPDEFGATIKLELGGINLDKMQNACSDQNTYVSCMNNYVVRNRSAIDAGHRLSGSIEYLQREAYNFDNSGITFAQDSYNSIVAKLGYGRKIQLGFSPMREATQFDLVASYEDVDDDPLRQDRGLINATFSHQLTEGVSFSLGFVWANKPEYRGGVDEEFSATTGITYKMSGLN